jgi:ABC-type polysaccharide/polyol phosphate export permease
VKYLVEVVLTFAIFFTPVFYEVEMFGRWGTLLLLNPVAPVLEGLSDCIVEHHGPPLAWIGYSAAVAALLGIAAPALFRRLEPKFAENI